MHLIRTLALTGCFLASPAAPLLTPVPAVAADAVVADAQLPFQFDRNVMVPMKDGVRLATHVYRPRGEGRYPVILLRTPYGKPDQNWGEIKRYLPAGYALVAQDCRGRGQSEGTWNPFFLDREDGLETQAWLGKQPWCNGDIGTSGGSYGGWTQWASAPGATPHLKCMVPVVPFAEVYEDIAYPGGAFQLALLLGWGASVAGVNLPPDKLAEAYRHLPLSTLGDQFERKIGYLNDWATHPTPDEYWQRRGIGPTHAAVTVPVLNIGGWYDIFSKTTLDLTDRVREGSTNRAMRRNQTVVMGPWAHGVGARKVGELDFGDEAVAPIGDWQFNWFEFWLKGRDTKVENWPAYRLFVMGENRWRNEHEWPLERTRFTPLYLRSGGRANSLRGDGALTFDLPPAEGTDTFVYDGDRPVPTLGGNNLVGAAAGPMDQTSVEQRDDVLVYTTEPLTQPVEVTGPVKAILFAASSAPDTDFTAKLVDVHPDGRAFNLCDGIQRARWRNSRTQPEPLTPGKVERFEIDLWVTSNLFQPGHRLRVEISSSNFPRFDRNANSGKPHGTDTELLEATQTVRHGGAFASHLLLPIIPR
ncbi:MAG: CocE/NonD family hydrolase [Verrucomicrobiales bacterium]|nr:CocE/NonD family hydrolase [Verrucomicrobiales bacterium]